MKRLKNCTTNSKRKSSSHRTTAKSKFMAEPTPAPTPNRAVYGFAWFLFFKTLFILYVCWALLPEYILHDVLGLTYLPDKYFALFLPILVLCALTIFAFLIYPPWNLSMQDDLNNIHTLRDKHMIVRCKHTHKTSGKQCKNKVDPIVANASNNYNSWLFQQYCDEHKIIENGNGDTNESDGFCDCIDKSKCLLDKRPNHLNVLEKRATVPNVCDLDINDVCKELFLDDHK